MDARPDFPYRVTVAKPANPMPLVGVVHLGSFAPLSE